MHKKNAGQLLDFFHLCERLKIERRNGKTSDGGEDKVASHSWRLAIIVMFLAPFFEKKINLLKALKIALIHDLPEVITGDQAYFEHAFDKKEKIKKKRREVSAIKKIVSNLPKKHSNELSKLWYEYENQTSYEAKIIKAADKIEAQLQHNEADISVWNKYDKKYYKFFLDQFCDFDKALKSIRKLVQNESIRKLS